MAAITKSSDLVNHLAELSFSENPSEALIRAGHVIDDGLLPKLRLNNSALRGRLPSLRRASKKAGRLSYSVNQASPPFTVAALAPGDFEFIAALKIAVANEIVAGFFDNGTIPATINLDQILTAEQLQKLTSQLIPDRTGGRIGRLFFTGPPLLSLPTGSPGLIRIHLPIRVNFETIIDTPFRTIRTVVTFFKGALNLVARLDAEVVQTDQFSQGVAPTIQLMIDLNDRFLASFETDTDSPVQRDESSIGLGIDFLAAELQLGFQELYGARLKVAISALIPLPIGSLEVAEIQTTTIDDVLLAGVKLTEAPDLGDIARLQLNFSNASDNFCVRTHGSVLSRLAQAALDSGQLTGAAKKVHPDAVIDSVHVDISNNRISIAAKGKIVDLCPLGVDLGFTTTTTLAFSLEGTRVKVTKSTNTNLDNGDAILCAITSLGIAIIVAVIVAILPGFGTASVIGAVGAFSAIGFLQVLLEYNDQEIDLLFGSGGGPTVHWIDLDLALPGTDLLPALTGEFFRIDDGSLVLGGTINARPDDTNSYFYIAFQTIGQFGRTQPLVDAKVQLIDRDNPPAPGDDVTLPPTRTVTTRHTIPNGTFSTTTTTSYERGADEVFKSVTTDRNGRIRIYLPKRALQSVGAKQLIRTVHVGIDGSDDGDDSAEMPNTKLGGLIKESFPDFFFQVVTKDGTRFDTSVIPSAHWLNFHSSRIGSPSAPLVVILGDARGPVVFDPSIG
jgi:hypothetical protein